MIGTLGESAREDIQNARQLIDAMRATFPLAAFSDLNHSEAFHEFCRSIDVRLHRAVGKIDRAKMILSQ